MIQFSETSFNGIMDEMLTLVVSNILLLAFIVYRDFAHRADMREKDEMIKDLNLKFMSKSTDEYKRAVEPEPEEMEAEEDPYHPLEDVPIEKLLEAKDRT